MVLTMGMGTLHKIHSRDANLEECSFDASQNFVRNKSNILLCYASPLYSSCPSYLGLKEKMLLPNNDYTYMYYETCLNCVYLLPMLSEHCTLIVYTNGIENICSLCSINRIICRDIKR